MGGKMIRGPIDGKYVELWGIPAWRRKLGIGGDTLTLQQRIEQLIEANETTSTIDKANARLAAFATLEEAGYIVQTSTDPPTFAGRQILGTTNQITVTYGTGIPGNTRLTLPQDIHDGAIPKFQSITPTLLTAEFVTYVNATGQLASTTVTAAELEGAVEMDVLTTQGDLLTRDASTYVRLPIGAANTVLRTDGVDAEWDKVVLTTDVTGVLPVANGGTNASSWTAGSVIFAGAGGTSLAEDNANLFWDDALNRLGVGTNAPLTTVQFVGSGFNTLDVVNTNVTGSPAIMASRDATGQPTSWVGLDEAGRVSYWNANGLEFRSYTAWSANYQPGGSALRVFINASGHVAVGVAVPLSRLHVAIDDAVATVTDVLRLNHSLSTGGTAANFGTGILLTGETSTTDAQDMARIQTIWTDSTHATRTSALQFQTVNSAGALATQMAISGNGRVGFGSSRTLTVDASYFPLVLGADLSTAITLTNNLGGAGIASSLGVFSANLQLAGTGTYGAVRGISFIINNANTSTASVLRGIYSSVRLNAPTARANTMIGGTFEPLTDSATGGTIVNMTGGEFRVAVQNAGVTATSIYGVRVLDLTNTGTITNTYGVWVGDITTGTQTNNAYAFYASDANAWNYFAGRVGIGTTLPGVMLDLGLAGTTLGVMRLAGSTSGNVTIQPQAIAGTWTLTLPVDDGTPNQVLSTDGGGISSWVTRASLPIVLTTDVTGILPIANGGTNANAFTATEGVVYFDGTRLVNSADLLYSGSELISRGVSLNGVNEPYAARNINTGAGAGTGYEAELADTSNNLITAGYLTWTKEQSWTTTATTQDSMADIATTLNGVTTSALNLRSSGSVVCGKDSTDPARTDDFLYLCTVSAAPSTAPITEFGSRAAITYNTNTKEIEVYDPTDDTWRSVAVT